MTLTRKAYDSTCDSTKMTQTHHWQLIRYLFGRDTIHFLSHPTNSGAWLNLRSLAR